MEGLKSKTFLLFLAFMLMITTFLPVFNSHVRFNIGNYKYWAILWFISVILLAPRTFADKFFLYVIFFCIIFTFLLLNTLWNNVNEWNKTLAQTEVLQFLIPISLYTYFRASRDFDGLAILVKWTLFFIAITAILSIYSSTIDPMYARNLIGGEYTKTEAMVFSKIGGGGYGFAGALIFLFPIIIYYYRNSVKIPFSKIQILIFGILCFVALIKMQIFANIILSFFGIIFALIGAKRFRKSLTYAVILFALVVIPPKTVYSDLLVGASSYFKPDSDIFFKLNDIAAFIKLGERVESSTAERAARYPLLWEGFKANPIYGRYNSNSLLDIALGGHLYWMNKLTVYGILGFIPFIIIFYIFIRKSIKQFDMKFTFYFLLSEFSGLAYGLMKNILGIEFWVMVFFIIPSLYYLPYFKKKVPLLKN